MVEEASFANCPENIDVCLIDSSNNNNNDGDSNNNSSDTAASVAATLLATPPPTETTDIGEEKAISELINDNIDLPRTTDTIGMELPTSAVSASQNDGAPSTSAKSSNGKLIMDYSTDFPKLPDAQHAANGSLASAGVWGQRRPVIQSTEITEAFKLSSAERASRGLGKFGDAAEEQHKCNAVAAATGTKIELCEAKDQSLNILITGKRNCVDEARARLVRELQTQCTREISIPKEFHGHIIGTKGQKLRQMEADFLCKIFIPGRDEKSDVIRILGPSDYIDDAARRIRDIGEEMAKQGTATLTIPREFYPWLLGPNDETINRIRADYPHAKIILPSMARNETIVITGERTDVEKAAAEIRKIYEDKKASMTTLTCKVPQAQMRYVIGFRRSGIEEIFRKTDVDVEVPSEDQDSDVVTLRGPASRIGDALALVYSKASSTISQEVHYDEWMRRFLIGPKGATLKQLVPNQDKLIIEFENGGVIYLEGPPKVVKDAHAALKAEVERLTKDMASEVVSAPPQLHRYIIGRSGANVNKLKEEHNVQIAVPKEESNSNEIRIEGNKDGVKKVVGIIKDIICRLENEKSRDIIIEHRFHGQIIGRNGENMQKWRQQFPTVAISFPDAGEKNDVVNLRGDGKEVDSLYKIINDYAKDLKDSSYQQTVPINAEYFKHIIGKSGANINRIRDETKTRIELPPMGSDGHITVIGRQANVEKAIQALNNIQNEMLRTFKVTVDVPSKYHQRLIGPRGTFVQKLMKRHNNVQVSIPRSYSNSTTITIVGLENDCYSCRAEIEKIVADLESMFTQEIDLDVRFHPRLIGQKGRNLRKVEDEYKVEIRMPGRNDPESTKVTVTGRVEKNVLDCLEYLHMAEEDFVAEANERGALEAARQEETPNGTQQSVNQLEITGAPWQLDNMEQFPAMNSPNGAQPPVPQVAGVWGQRRW